MGDAEQVARQDARYQRALDLIASLEARLKALEEWREKVEYPDGE